MSDEKCTNTNCNCGSKHEPIENATETKASKDSDRRDFLKYAGMS